MIGAVVAFIIGALLALGAFLLVCEALPQWRYWNRRINRDVQTLRDMPYGYALKLGADGMWHWHENDEESA